jgi:hypothetical protein
MTRAAWGSRKRQILDLVSAGHGDRDIARLLDIRPEQVSTTRRRGGIRCVKPGKPGAKQGLSGDVMAWLYAELGSYVVVARAMRVSASTVHEAVQRRVT